MTLVGVFSFLVLIISVVIHEVSHGYAALYLGDLTAKYAGRLTLNPIKHIDPVGSIIVPIITSLAGISFGWAKPVPFNPDNLSNRRWGEAIVAVAGPLSNIILALVFALVARNAILFAQLISIEVANSIFFISSLIVLVNLSLAFFNLMPIPPLDGSKILFAILPRKYPEIRAVLERHQLMLILIFIFILWKSFDPIVLNLFTFLIGVPLGL